MDIESTGQHEFEESLMFCIYLLMIFMLRIVSCVTLWIGIPLLLPLCTMLKKKIEGQKTSMFGWVIFYAIGCVMAASPWLINTWLNGFSG